MPDTRAEYEKQRAQLSEELNVIAPEPLRSKLGALIRPAIEIETAPSRGELAPLASKFGGTPDVPPGFEWPHFGDEPLSFVAQLNLGELAPFDLEERLPKSGLLSFWMGSSWGADFGDWRVWYFDEDHWQKLEAPQSSKPQNLWQRFKARNDRQIQLFSPTPLQFHTWASHPWGCAEFYDNEQKMSDEQFARDRSGGHQIFGFPENIQNDVRDDCALYWNGFLNSSEAHDMGLSPERDQTTWRDWQLLLQVGEDDHARMVWGDAGMIYFLVRRVDLEARRFERCWFVFQCG